MSGSLKPHACVIWIMPITRQGEEQFSSCCAPSFWLLRVARIVGRLSECEVFVSYLYLIFAAAAGLENLLLLGRSGRGDIGPAAFGNACVTLHRCDVSSKEEVRPPSRKGNGCAASLLRFFRVCLERLRSRLCILSVPKYSTSIVAATAWSSCCSVWSLASGSHFFNTTSLGTLTSANFSCPFAAVFD